MVGEAFSDVRFVAAGGVTTTNATELLAAGASALGVERGLPEVLASLAGGAR
jgi:2-keto-3-deoxy-6-phosphogluconate aldolase